MNVAVSGFEATRYMLLCLLAGVFHPVYAGDDSYLKELEAEAHNLSVQNTAPPSVAAPEVKKDAPAAPAVSQSDLNKAEFETALKAQLPNTYNIYIRLTPEQKFMVVETYFANDRKIASASRQVFDFYLFDRKRAN